MMLEGRVVDERRAPHAGLTLTAEDLAAEPAQRLAQAVTDADGRFRLAVEEDDWDAPAGLALGVYDALGLRLLVRHRAADLAAGGRVRDLVVASSVARGWRVTGALDPGQLRQSDGNAIDALIDDEQFAAVAAAIGDARRAICLSQLLFDADFMLSPGRARQTAMDALADAARRGVTVRLLLNDNAVVRDSCERAEAAAIASGAPTFLVRRFPVAPNVMHAKLMIVDDEVGFVLGPPFQSHYWDTPRHARDEPRRHGEKPLHDVSVRIRGPAVAHLHESFARLWNARGAAAYGGTDFLPPLAPRAAAGDARLQVVHTTPPRALPDSPEGERTILEAYLRALASARDYVYLETQYFTSPVVSEAITRALRLHDELQVILVLNEDTDVPGYVQWQIRRLAEMGHPRERLGVFVLRDARPIYVHSKVALADDSWATLGTANLDSMSLDVADEFAAPIEPNLDTNVVVLDGVEGAPRTGFVAALRRRLWAEHLADEGVWSARRPADGWLALWRDVAAQNARRSERGEPMAGRALPYVPRRIERRAGAP